MQTLSHGDQILALCPTVHVRSFSDTEMMAAGGLHCNWPSPLATSFPLSISFNFWPWPFFSSQHPRNGPSWAWRFLLRSFETCKSQPYLVEVSFLLFAIPCSKGSVTWKEFSLGSLKCTHHRLSRIESSARSTDMGSAPHLPSAGRNSDVTASVFNSIKWEW